MLIQSSLPIEAEISFVFDHGKQEFLCNWMPGAETWQKCSKCDKRPQGVSREAVPVTEGKRNNDNSCSLNFPRSCSQLSTISTMSKNSTPTFVYQQDLQHLPQTHNSGQNPRPYQRRKHPQNSITVFSAQASANTKRSDDYVSAPTFVYQRRKHPQNSIAVFSAQASANTKRSDGCVSAISSEAPSVAAEEKNVLSLVELENDTVRAPVMLPSECNRGALVSKSESISKCSFAEEPGPEEAQESDVRKIIDVCCVNESCSSSKSNMELGSASLKTDVDDTGECSSSDSLIMEELQNDLSEKDICISILRSEGLLEGVCPIGTCTFAGSVTTSSYSSCLRSCKVCGQSENTLKMLICDHCEEAFHMSCCIPRIRKIPADDWFCHSCFKKKHKILKESETGRCRIATLKGELGSIASMLKDSEPYATSVRIGKDFQAEVPDWSGPITNGVDPIGEPMEMDPSDCISWQKLNSHKPSRLSSIGNWLQCREIIEGLGEGVDGTICGKWRRAPLFEVQTDDWECFRSVLWDPAHADCAVPQELDTDQVLKHLKYIEMLRPRLDVKRRKLSCTNSVSSQDLTENVKNVRTQ